MRRSSLKKCPGDEPGQRRGEQLQVTLPSQFTRYPTAALLLPVVLMFKRTSSPKELVDSYLEYLFFSLGFFRFQR